MNTAAAAAVQPILTVVPPRDKDKSKIRLLRGKGEVTPPGPPPLKVSMDVIDKFEEASNHLAAFLDGLYKIGTSVDIPKADTIVFFAGQAEECLKEMEKVFEEITGQNEGK